MEKHIWQIKKNSGLGNLLYYRTFIFALAVLFLCGIAGFSQEVPSQIEQIRLQVFAELDGFPGSFGDEETDDITQENQTPSYDAQKWKDADLNTQTFHQVFDFSINRTKQIAPFLLGGMLYGWNYEYTPYDKMRRVSEYWSFEPVQDFNKQMNPIEVHNPVVKDGNLVSWVYCNRTAAQIKNYQVWTSIVYPKVRGVGTCSVEKGFEGIKEACSMAAKNAVREYWRTREKNKPKEISGSLLLVDTPRIFVKNGEYKVELDFFMETDRIIPYTLY